MFDPSRMGAVFARIEGAADRLERVERKLDEALHYLRAWADAHPEVQAYRPEADHGDHPTS